jgi:hypothetical protein
LADVTPIDDPSLVGYGADALTKKINGHHAIFFVADTTTILRSAENAGYSGISARPAFLSPVPSGL